MTDWIVIPFVAGFGQIPVAGPQEKTPQLGGAALPCRPFPLCPKTGHFCTPGPKKEDLAGLNREFCSFSSLIGFFCFLGIHFLWFSECWDLWGVRSSSLDLVTSTVQPKEKWKSDPIGLMWYVENLCDQRGDFRLECGRGEMGWLKLRTECPSAWDPEIRLAVPRQTVVPC